MKIKDVNSERKQSVGTEHVICCEKHRWQQESDHAGRNAHETTRCTYSQGVTVNTDRGRLWIKSGLTIRGLSQKKGNSEGALFRKAGLAKASEKGRLARGLLRKRGTRKGGSQKIGEDWSALEEKLLLHIILVDELLLVFWHQAHFEAEIVGRVVGGVGGHDGRLRTSLHLQIHHDAFSWTIQPQTVWHSRMCSRLWRRWQRMQHCQLRRCWLRMQLRQSWQ